jgi:glycosyltransferase involved in cell wall biosynthesis
MGADNRTLVLIPAFNEEAALPGVLKELAEVVADLDVLVIDDGSRDATATVARGAGVRVAELPFNLGVGGALRTGFRYALRAGYDRAVQLDGDGQHDPGQIEHLLAALDAGADMVVGSRFAEGASGYEVGRARGGAMRLLRLVIHVLVGRRFTDTSSGFRAFGPDAIRVFAETFPAEYLSDTAEALLVAAYAGLAVEEVPVEMRQRSTGVPSTRNLRLVYHYVRLLTVIAFTASRRPMTSKE